VAERPKAVLFDVGNVLLRLKTEAFIAALQEACPSLDKATMMAELRSPQSPHMAYERGEISGEAFHAHFRDIYGLPWDYGRWLSHWNDYFLPNRPMDILVAKLRPQAELWALSNTNAEHYSHFKRAYRLFDAFKEVIGSHQHGLRKPDARLYAIALGRMGLPPASVLFIDDLPANVEAAAALGMPAFQYSFNDLELKAFCVELGFEISPWESRPSPFSC
jgi:HAD superfamily hydrolase (TIGR01509 family)